MRIAFILSKSVRILFAYEVVLTLLLRNSSAGIALKTDPYTGEDDGLDDGEPAEYDDTGEANDIGSPTWGNAENTSQSGEA